MGKKHQKQNDLLSVKIIDMPKDKKSIIEIITIVISIFSLMFSLGQYIATNNKENDEALRKQAESVSAWIKDDESEMEAAEKAAQEEGELYSVVSLNNLSSSPIYNVVITVVEIGSDGLNVENGKAVRARMNEELETGEQFNDNGVILNILAPGEYKSKIAFISHGMNKRFGVEIAFRDYFGNSWLISADGHIYQIEEDPFEYYELPLPVPIGAIQDRN